MNLTLQSLSLGLIVSTVCILMLAVVLLPAFGAPVDETARVYVFGLFASMASAGVAWIGASRAADAKVNTAMRMLKIQGDADAVRAELESLKVGKE